MKLNDGVLFLFIKIFPPVKYIFALNIVLFMLIRQIMVLRKQVLKQNRQYVLI